MIQFLTFTVFGMAFLILEAHAFFFNKAHAEQTAQEVENLKNGVFTKQLRITMAIHIAYLIWVICSIYMSTRFFALVILVLSMQTQMKKDPKWVRIDAALSFLCILIQICYVSYYFLVA